MEGNAKKVLDLEPPVPASGNTYLGCTQEDIAVPEEDVLTKTHLFNRLLFPKAGLSQDSEKQEAMKAKAPDLAPPLPKAKKKSKAKAKSKTKPKAGDEDHDVGPGPVIEDDEEDDEGGENSDSASAESGEQ